ncbi:hypothetical protein ACLMJK_003779 [Lecanora helva]
MSYNPYPKSTPNYSSYYQQSANRTGNYTDHSRNGATYSPNQYQPLSAYQSNQRPQYTSQATNPQYYGSTASDNRSYGARAGYNDGRSSVDTTALGNLAYASSLGRDTSTPTQAAPYSTNSPNYRPSGSYNFNNTQPQYQAGYEGTNTGSAATSGIGGGSQAATASPSFGYSSNNQARPPATTSNSANHTLSQPPKQQYQISQVNRPPSRPSSGQAVGQSHSRNGSQGLQSPAIPANNVNNAHGQNENSSGTHRIRTPQQPLRSPQPAISAHPPQPSQNKSNTSQRGQNLPGVEKVSQAAKTNGQNEKNASKPSTPIAQSMATVDPSHVFNDVEYRRKQAAAAAEAEAARKKAEDARNTAQPDSENAANGSSSKKTQMELEMKMMIEKMRDYKSQDPSLFSEIWEQVKKGQPAPAARASVQPQSKAKPINPSPIVIDDQSATPDPQIQLPPESELPAADTPPPGLDRGRFPAQRRRRGGANYTPPPKKQGTPKNGEESSNRNNRTPKNGDAPTGGGNSGDRLQKAMQDFHSGVPTSGAPSTTPVAQMTEHKPAPVPPNAPGFSAVPSSNQPREAQNESQSSAQARSQPPKAGSTYWPEHKKRELAEAACTALLANSRNAGKDISADELHNLLDTNPSYTLLCEMLEFRGLDINRGEFARQLLAAVPDLGSASKNVPAKSSPHEPPTSSQQPRSSQQPPTGYWHPPAPSVTPSNRFAPPYGAPRSVPTPPIQQSYHQQALAAQSNGRNGHGMLYPVAPYPPPVYPPNTYPPSVPNTTPSLPPSNNGVQSAKQQEVAHQSQAQWQQTKQAMARKRSFGDIVDLTQDLSDEDEPPPQRMRIEQDQQNQAQRPEEQTTEKTSTNKAGISLEDKLKFNADWATAGKYIHYEDIIQPMNIRKDALRRSSYDPKTITRDILLAVGKHPYMEPLNNHLEPLPEHFRAVNHESDLSTFRWDLVDPEKPKKERREHAVDRKGDDKTVRDIEMKLNNEVLSANNQAQPHLVAVGKADDKTVRNTGIKPNNEGLPANGQAEPRPFDFADYIRKDLPNMLNPTTRKYAGQEQSSQEHSKGYQITPNAFMSLRRPPNFTAKSNDNLRQVSSPATPPGPRRVGRPPGTKKKVSSSATPPEPKRVGRPPGAKNKNPRPGKSVSKMSQDATSTQAENSTKASSGDVYGTLVKPSQPLTNSVPNHSSVSTTPVRPSPLRDGIAVVIRSRSPSISLMAQSQNSTKRRRISMTNGATDHQSPTPSYKVFRCKWEHCPAELHNLETLKKHVRKHGKLESSKSGPIRCLWEDCFVLHVPETRETSDHRRMGFDSMLEWDKHVEGAHIDPLGDKNEVEPVIPSVKNRRMSSNLQLKSDQPRRLSSSASTPVSAKPMIVIPD